MTVNSLAFIRGQTKYWGWGEAGVTCATLCKGDHPTSKNEQTERFFYTLVAFVSVQCAVHRTCWFTHLLSRTSQQFTDRKPVYTAFPCISQQFTHKNQFTHLLPCIGSSQTENQFTLLLCICWQFTDRKPVYTVVAMYQSATRRWKTSLHHCCCVSVGNSQTETSLHICCHVLATCRQKTSLHICFHVSVNNLHTKTSLHLCCCVSVGSSQQFTQLLPGTNQQLTDRKPVYTSVAVYQSTIHRQKPV